MQNKGQASKIKQSYFLKVLSEGEARKYSGNEFQAVHILDEIVLSQA